MRRVLVAAVGLVATACSGALARPAAPVPTTAATIPAPVPTIPAPSPSPPTAPAPPQPTRLTARLDALLVNTNSCLLVTDGRTGQVLYAHQPDTPFTPASTQKLLVATAALDVLGPDYRFTTTVVAAAPPAGGVVGDVWLVGGGDPLLASPDYAAHLAGSPVTSGYPVTPLSALADHLVERGVRRIAGGVHGDDGRDEAVRYLPTWGPSINRGEFDVGPLSALEVDQGLDHWQPATLTADPAGHSAGVLAALLRNRGVAAQQGADAPAPARPLVLATVQSAPLSAVIGAMLQASDNQIAELLVREIDRRGGGDGGTPGGVRRVMDDIAALGLPHAGISLVDGSGLSRADHASCRTLLAALDLGDQPRFAALRAGLPVAGVSGTLAYLFRGTPLAGRLAAKGGYIEGVAGLIGRIDGPGARRFALLVNGPFPFTVGLALQEGVAEAVAAG